MADEALELKIVRTGQVYRTNVARLRQWLTEGRVVPEDLVRRAGTQRWVRVQDAFQLGAPAAAPPASPPASPPAPAGASTAVAAGAAGEAPAAEDEGDLGIDVPAKTQRGRRRKILPDIDLDMTPMIDVTFQLLIFFMFTNSLANQAPIEVPEAQYGRGVLPDGKQAILIDDQGRYYFGESTRPEDIAPSLDALVQQVAENAANQDAALDVIISAHKRARHRPVRELVEQLSKVPRIGVIRLGVEERQ